MSAIQILIADDHELFRRTVRSFIESEPSWHVCGEAGDGLEAVEKATELRPQVILMDINMPRMDGLEATRIIRRELPDCHVIIVTQNHESIARQQAAAVDARGSVTKSELTRDLRPTIEKLFANPKGETVEESGEKAPSAQGTIHGGGALGRLVSEFDWAKTPLGSIEAWPQSLKTVVRVLLTSRFAMWMSWGPELTFLYNDDYARMTLGKKHPWALGKPSREVWKEIWDDIGPRIRRVLETGQATWDEALLLFLERSGYREETYHTFSYSPLSGDDGEVAGHLCVVTEETDRVIGERRLRTLRSLAGELSKTITEEDVASCVVRCLGENQKDLPFTLIYLLTEDGKEARLAGRTGIAEGHPAAPESIRLTAQNEVWPISDLLGGKDSVLVEDLSERFLSVPSGSWDKSPLRALLLPITRQGQDMPAGVLVAGLNPYRPLDVSYAGFINLAAGQIAASIANARAHAAEKKRAEALAEIDRAKTAFFSNVSHEFRTPLTLMLGPLQDLLSRSQTHLSPTAKEQLDLVNRNGARLLRLVNTLLDFSRIEAGRVQAVYQATDLARFTAELASVFRSATDKAGLRLVVVCPDLQEPVYVDRDMWEKVVLNLISNAFKFTFSGEISVSVRRVGETAELQVRDTGVGIPAEALPKLFERFNRVPNMRSRTHEGSGIGLALVQELVKLHGGSIRTESTVGKGSVFVVSIPFGQSHLVSGQMGGSRSLSSTAVGAKPFVEEALRWLPDSAAEGTEVFSVQDELLPIPSPPVLQVARPRVLIADDNSDMRQYLARLLAEHYEVETAPDGQVALEAARKHAPDLIVSDVMMPALDGFELLKALRAEDGTHDIPVVLLSARAGEESRIEGLQAGASDYLIKPFSARELLARISGRLEIARLQREGAQRIAADLQAMTRLQGIGNLCMRSGDEVNACLDEILSAAVELTGALKGTLQLLDRASGALTILAHRGFDEPFLKFFASVKDDNGMGGTPLLSSGRVIVEVITQSDIFSGKPTLAVLQEAGVRAVLSTPLLSTAGQVLGVISAHFPRPHHPGERELRLVDLLARQAADYLERRQAEQALRERNVEFETLLKELRRSDSQLRKSQAELEQRVQERTEELLNASHELRELSARILRAQDEERRRIARELHDGAGQLLAALSMEVSSVTKESSKLSSRAAASVGNIESLVVQMTQDIRTTSHLLYPPLLDEIGLQSALTEYVRGLADRSGIQVSLDLPTSLERLDRDYELSLFRIVQECLTNIHRHSGSKTATIRLVRNDESLSLEVRDGGKGMSPEKLSEIQSRGSGVGIRGMRERVRQLSGTLRIESDKSGTRIFVSIPIPNLALGQTLSNNEPLQTAN